MAFGLCDVGVKEIGYAHMKELRVFNSPRTAAFPGILKFRILAQVKFQQREEAV